MNKPTPKFVQGLVKMPFMVEDDVPVLTSDTPLGKLKFWGYGITSEFRVRTLLTKEPETIEWINSFEPDSTFWDIGANIGIYSLYASLLDRVRVMAFEPSSFNYFLLNKNIYLNQKDQNIQAYNIAFSDKNSLDTLYMPSVGVGDAANSFLVAKDGLGNEMNVAYRQGCVGYKIDNFIRQYNILLPNYLKIDVDGIESLILEGAKLLLSNESLTSVLVEVHEDKTDEVEFICRFMKNCGFTKIVKRHPPDFDDAYYKPVFNYIFYRN